MFRSSLSSSQLSGLFCVYTDNYPCRLRFSSLDYVDSQFEAEDRISQFSGPGDLVAPPPSFLPPQSEYYRSGDPIEILFLNGARGYLPLPSSLNGELCHDGNPVTYLTDQTSSCLRLLSSDGAECNPLSSFSAEAFYQNFSVFPTPSSSMNDNNSTMIPVELQSQICYDMVGQEVSCDSLSPVFDVATSQCNNTLLSLSYEILHDATQGLVSVSVSIRVGVVSVGPVTQTYSVQFVYSDNETESVDLVRSGNPGYIQGQPVLGGIRIGETVNVSSDSSRWLTVLRGDGRGYCQGDRESVTFRDDFRSSCILRYATV